MTCCIVALALAWQLIAAWRRLTGFLGIAPRARIAPRSLGVMAANALDALRHPAWRVALLAVVAVEAGVAGAYVYEHRFHIGNEVAAVVFDSTGFALAMCRELGLVTTGS